MDFNKVDIKMNINGHIHKPYDLPEDADDTSTVKLVVMKSELLPGNPIMSVFRAIEDTPDYMWEVQGHEVIEVPTQEARKLLDAQKSAIDLQVRLQVAFNKEKEITDARYEQYKKDGVTAADVFHRQGQSKSSSICDTEEGTDV